MAKEISVQCLLCGDVLTTKSTTTASQKQVCSCDNQLEVFAYNDKLCYTARHLTDIERLE